MNAYTDEAIVRALAVIDAVPKPIEQILRSGEGGEHMVWVINNAFVLRVRADGQDDTLLVREKQLWELLRSVDASSNAVPNCLEIGMLGEENRPYGLYRKLRGVSLEASPQSVTNSTEEELTQLLLLLKTTPVEKARGLGIDDAERVNSTELRGRARKAWQRLHDNGHIPNLARRVDVDEALRLSERATETTHESILLHADLKGEHIFVDPKTGRLTGVIDWSDACIGHPSVDIHGLAISVGAVAAARIASRAGYDEEVVARGIFAARCDSMIYLDAILHEDDDSPEWLLRLQLQRALEQTSL